VRRRPAVPVGPKAAKAVAAARAGRVRPAPLQVRLLLPARRPRLSLPAQRRGRRPRRQLRLLHRRPRVPRLSWSLPVAAISRSCSHRHLR
jgi:hypothetical protein